MPECRMNEISPLQQLTRIAPEIEGIDVDCYRRHGQDPTRAIVGLGNANAKWCFFGRDPGDQEVRLQTPFVGEAGQKIRVVMSKSGLTDDDIYWMNTVPFKPIDNKAWSVSVRRKCRPALLELFFKWEGSDVITFGEAAFKWFGLGSSKDRKVIEEFWAREDKYKAQLQISLEFGGVERGFTLYPVPHPSGANAIWSSRFPGLLVERLRGSQTPSVLRDH